MIAGRYFVTPHAVRRFQERIAPWMSYSQALGTIIRCLEETTCRPTPLHHEPGLMIRVRRPYNFRAVIKPSEEGAPVVATILRSGRAQKERQGKGARERSRERWEQAQKARSACGATGGGVD